LPTDVAVKHLLEALIPKLGLSTHQDGQQIVYKLRHMESQRTIPDDETLADAGVLASDVCLLLREEKRTHPQRTHYHQQPDNMTVIAAAHDIIAKSYALLSGICGRDGKALAWDDRIVCCPLCGTPYHYQCWRANGNQCSQPGCEGRGTIQPQELIDYFWGMSELIGELMEEFPPESRGEMEEMFNALTEVDLEIIDRCDEFEEQESKELLEELEEGEGEEYEYGDELEEPKEGLPEDTLSVRYTKHHVWIDITSGEGRVGITDFLTQQLFLILGVEFPEEGQKVTAGEVVSSIWALSESMEEFDVPVFSPVSGVISAVNKNLRDRFLRSAQLELIQEDPYGAGWLFTIQLSGISRTEFEKLMNTNTYQEFVRRILES